MHGPKKLGTARLSRWDGEETPPLQRPVDHASLGSVQCSSLLRCWPGFPGSYTFLLPPSRWRPVLCTPPRHSIDSGRPQRILLWQSRGNAQGSGRFPAELNSTLPAGTRQSLPLQAPGLYEGKRSGTAKTHGASVPVPILGSIMKTHSPDLWVTLHSEMKKIPDNHLFAFIYK